MDGGASIVNWSRDGMSLSSISYNVVSTDIGAFFSRVNFFHNLHFLITVQEQLKSKRSPLRQAILPPGIIEGNRVRCWTANCRSLKGVTKRNERRKNIHTDVDFFI